MRYPRIRFQYTQKLFPHWTDVRCILCYRFFPLKGPPFAGLVNDTFPFSPFLYLNFYLDSTQRNALAVDVFLTIGWL